MFILRRPIVIFIRQTSDASQQTFNKAKLL